MPKYTISPATRLDFRLSRASRTVGGSSVGKDSHRFPPKNEINSLPKEAISFHLLNIVLEVSLTANPKSVKFDFIKIN